METEVGKVAKTLPNISYSWDRKLFSQIDSTIEVKKLIYAISDSFNNDQAKLVFNCSCIWNHFVLPKYPFDDQVWQKYKLQSSLDIWYILREQMSIICTIGIY